jgi:catecholate siderophore receptor
MLLGGTTAAIAAISGPAAAQSGGGAPDRLPEIRVRAESEGTIKTDAASSPRFTAPLLDTPKSVTVIPNEVMRQINAVSVTEALRTTPGITFGAGEGGNPVGDRPFLRGYDAQSSTYVDGLRDIAPGSREVFNIESIEVIKGSSSAFSGRGGAGGVINLTTKTPKLERFSSGTIGLGTDNYKRATLDGNWLFSDNGAFRLNAMVHDADVPGRDGPTNERWGIAPSVAFGLGTPTRLVASFFHMQSDDVPESGMPYNLPATFPRTGSIELQPNTGGDRSNWYGLFARDFRKEKADMATLLVEHDISSTMHLRNITRLTDSSLNYVWTQPDDSQGNVRNGLVWRRQNSTDRDIKTIANNTELAGEVRAGGRKHTYTAGVELSREKADNDTYNLNFPAYTANQRCPSGAGAASGYMCTSLFDPNPNDPWLGTLTLANNPTSYRTDTVSVYGFDTMELTPKWSVNLGLRYDHYDTRQENPIDGVTGARPSFAREDDLFNVQFGAVYKPTVNSSIYASYATSSTPGGGTLGQGSETQGIATTGRGAAVNGDQLAPEKNRSLELGSKWDVLDRRLSLTAAVFRIETTNARIANPDGTATMGGDKVVNGLELGFAGNVTRQWQLFGGYTYLDSEGRNLGLSNVGTATAPIWVPNAGTGLAFPNTPKHSFSLWSTYRPMPDWMVGAGVFYQGKVYGGYAYGATVPVGGTAIVKRSVPSYARLDAMVSYVVNRNLTLQLNLQNLTDKVYYNTAYPTHYANIAPGRAAILTASLSF